MKVLIQWTAKNLGVISITISAFCFALLTTLDGDYYEGFPLSLIEEQ